MALEGFRETLWSRNAIINTDKALVYGNVANRDYQGEITASGNVVKINEIGDITIGDYTEGTDISVQTLTDAQKELVIDQKKYFSFSIDSVLKAQSNVSLMDKAMMKAGFNMADNIDKFLAAKYTEAGITTANMGTSGSPLTIYSVGDGYDQMIGVITNAARYLDESNAPTQGRWMVIPAWMHQYLKFAQIVDNAEGGIKGGDTTRYGNGFIGNTLGFDIYASNNVSYLSTEYRVMFGTPDALSFAGQITEITASPMEKQFGDMVKGLYVYGAKVVRPDHLGVAYLAAGGLST